MMPSPYNKPNKVGRPKKPPKAVKVKDIVSVLEFNTFLNKHGIADIEFAEIFGVSVQAVWLWKKGERELSLTNSKVIRLLDRYPQLLKEL